MSTLVILSLLEGTLLGDRDRADAHESSHAQLR
jgi:hypothetical protein